LGGASQVGGLDSGCRFIGSLTENGGPTETHALEAGSVAIDVIPAETVLMRTTKR
jgi:hypothetical protein